MGCLLFDDAHFCRQLVNLLKGHVNQPIAEIGSIDLSDML